MNATLEARPSLESSGFIPERGFLVALARDVKLAARSRGEVIQALAFFVVVVSLFPLAIGPESALLKRIAPGVVWVAVLLSVFSPCREYWPTITPMALLNNWRYRFTRYR